MSLDFQKELTPVLYNASGIKFLKSNTYNEADKMCFSMHWHERMELILVTEGALHCRVKHHEATLTANQLLIVPPKYPHYGISAGSGVSYDTLMFDPHPFCNGLPITKKCLHSLMEQKINLMPWTDSPEVIRVVKELLEIDSMNDSYSELLQIGKLYELIAALYRHCLLETSSVNVADEQFQNVLNYINQHFCEPISTVAISRQFGYSQGYFCRRFKQVTGLAPMIYIRILRLEKACKLLQEQNHAIGKIATDCGFFDVSYFSKCFKEHYQMTPTEFLRNSERG